MSIDNGKTTKVWLEKWVMTSHPRRPINKQSLIDINLDVAALLTPEMKWRGNVVNELFPAVEVPRILAIPGGGVQDKHIWAYTDHGSYTVKSGYWYAANHPLIPPLPQSSLALTVSK